MKIFFINNDGRGFADDLEVDHGTTVEKLFEREMGRHMEADNYLIRVNRMPCSRSQVLQENDRVTVTPNKIQVAV